MTPDEMFEVMRDHGSFVMDRIPTLPTPPDMVGPQAIIRFLWMAGTLQQYAQIPYPAPWERHMHDLAMHTYMLLDARLSRRWLIRPVEKAGFRAPAAMPFAAGAITKGDWPAGYRGGQDMPMQIHPLPVGGDDEWVRYMREVELRAHLVGRDRDVKFTDLAEP
jgi:hypothetical protein